jgi:hypothetical protein
MGCWTFCAVSDETFLGTLDFIAYNLKMNLVMKYGVNRLKDTDVLCAMHFLEYLKTIERCGDDDNYVFSKEDLEKIFCEKNINLSSRDFENTTFLLTGNYCDNLLTNNIHFGYLLNVAPFNWFKDDLSKRGEFLGKIYTLIDCFLSCKEHV